MYMQMCSQKDIRDFLRGRHTTQDVVEEVEARIQRVSTKGEFPEWRGGSSPTRPQEFPAKINHTRRVEDTPPSGGCILFYTEIKFNF
jgi:hypothetical protein